VSVCNVCGNSCDVRVKIHVMYLWKFMGCVCNVCGISCNVRVMYVEFHVMYV